LIAGSRVSFRWGEDAFIETVAAEIVALPADKARLLAKAKVKAKYDAVAPEFEISAELVKARWRASPD
jgi:hypothetical protein